MRGLGCRFEGAIEREVRLEAAIPLRVYAFKTADVLEGQISADIAHRHLLIYMQGIHVNQKAAEIEDIRMRSGGRLNL